MKDNLFTEVGGMPCLNRVHKIFYDKLLCHPWLKEFFIRTPQPHLESQQSDFMARLFGGPNVYSGRLPKSAHVHMYITEDVFMERHRVLEQSLTEAGIPENLKKRWLSYDMGMKKALVKSSISECEGRFKTDPIISVQARVGGAV